MENWNDKLTEVNTILDESLSNYFTDVYAVWETKEQIELWKEVKNNTTNPLFWTWSDWDLVVPLWTTYNLDSWIYNFRKIIIEWTLTTASTSWDIVIKSQYTSIINWSIDFSWKETSYRWSNTIYTSVWEIFNIWATWQWWNWWNWYNLGAWFWLWWTAQNGYWWWWAWWPWSNAPSYPIWWNWTNWWIPWVWWASKSNSYTSATVDVVWNNATWLWAWWWWWFWVSSYTWSIASWFWWVTDPTIWTWQDWWAGSYIRSSWFCSAWWWGGWWWRYWYNWLNTFLYLNNILWNWSIKTNWENGKNGWSWWAGANYSWLWAWTNYWWSGWWWWWWWSSWALWVFYIWDISWLTFQNNVWNWWLWWSWAVWWSWWLAWWISTKIIKDISTIF